MLGVAFIFLIVHIFDRLREADARIKKLEEILQQEEKQE
jgi:uncharacterized protein YoxC